MKFSVGDYVTFVNDYGVVFPGKTITAVDESDFAKDYGPRYFVEPTDAPWFSKHERSLMPETALC